MLPEEVLGRFALRFAKKEIELACGGVGIQLMVPALLVARLKPLDDVPVFFRTETIDCGPGVYLNRIDGRNLLKSRLCSRFHP